MVYLIHSNQIPAIKNRVKKVAKQILGELDDMNFVRYDGSEVLIQDCVDDANNVPLGYDKKIVVIENCSFLLKTKGKAKQDNEKDQKQDDIDKGSIDEKKKKKTEPEIDEKYRTLLDFIKNPSDECNIILTVEKFELDTSSILYKAIEEFGTLIPIADPDESTWNQGVAKYCRETLGMNIDNDAVMELADRTGGDVASLQNNAMKLSLYKDHITYEDVCLMVTRPLEDDTFKLSTLLISENNIGALALYRDLRVANTEPVALIALLANNFLQLSKVSFLVKQRMSNEEIASELKIKVGYAAILARNSSRISNKALNRALEDLYNLDLQIKSGLVDRFYAFELFLINFKVR